jgi:hypothetical protein
MIECKRIEDGTCKKCSACGIDCKYYIPKEKADNAFGYGYGMWGGRIVDLLPHGARYYMNGKRW